MKDCMVSFKVNLKKLQLYLYRMKNSFILYTIDQFNHHYHSMLCLRSLHCTRLWGVVSIGIPHFIGISINKIEMALICSTSQVSCCCLDLTSFS